MERLPNILKDPLYLACISESTNSLSEYEKYGSILIKGNRFMGIGHNRAIANGIVELKRRIRQGYANHGEIEAINDALSSGFKREDIKGASILCAGHFPKTKRLFLHKEYTCTKCLPHMLEWGIENIVIPSREGWVVRPVKDTSEEAKKYLNGTHNKRKESVQGNYFLHQLSL